MIIVLCVWLHLDNLENFTSKVQAILVVFVISKWAVVKGHFAGKYVSVTVMVAKERIVYSVVEELLKVLVE